MTTEAELFSVDNSINDNIETLRPLVRRRVEIWLRDQQANEPERININELNKIISLLVVFKIIDKSQEMKKLIEQMLVKFGHVIDKERVRRCWNGFGYSAKQLEGMIERQKNLNDRLIKSCKNGYILDARNRLSEGADVCADDNAPLTVAVHNGHIAIVRLLLERGADPNAREGIFLITAVHNRRTDIVQLLIDHGADVTANDHKALVTACEGNADLEIVQILIQNGADLSAQDNYILLRACKLYGRDEVKLVEFLLQNNVDATVNDNEAIKNASQKNTEKSIRMTELLLEHGADIRAIDENFVYYAMIFERTELVKRIITEGLVYDKEKLFIQACALGNLEIAQLMIDAGANVCADDNDILQEASKNGHDEIVELLLENSATGLEDALIAASSNGHVDIAKLLLEKIKLVSSQT